VPILPHEAKTLLELFAFPFWLKAKLLAPVVILHHEAK